MLVALHLIVALSCKFFIRSHILLVLIGIQSGFHNFPVCEEMARYLTLLNTSSRYVFDPNPRHQRCSSVTSPRSFLPPDATHPSPLAVSSTSCVVLCEPIASILSLYPIAHPLVLIWFLSLFACRSSSCTLARNATVSTFWFYFSLSHSGVFAGHVCDGGPLNFFDFPPCTT